MDWGVFCWRGARCTGWLGNRGGLECDVDGFLAFVFVSGGVPFLPFAGGPIVFHGCLEALLAVVVPGFPVAVE